MEVDGTTIDEKMHIWEVVDDHFKKLFGSQNSYIWQGDVPDMIAGAHKINGEMFPTDFQVKKAIWALGANKAPGPDRFPTLFYLHFGTLLEVTYSGSLTISMREPYN